ncbi:hypothetical protein CC78DRAFT_274092 [Lojkania enalia]|uniref:BZIP domain-containing protein n=1 Tax=Lojkania enalia TaxID=147567 RepID=A0A9P4K816_9PLEO|nr:hypothetical protein CC78DRAFT_274092 [Didymosphaeria enalia]
MADSNKESASDSRDNAQYLKRREQVRRAQRTHRERKEQYIKSLENEVLQLRTNEAKIVQETKNLYTEISRLKKILDHHGISYEASQNYSLPSHPSDISNPQSLVSVRPNPHNRQQLHIHDLGKGAGNQFYLSESDGSPPVPESSKSLRRKLSFFRSRGRSSPPSPFESQASGQTPSAGDISAISASASNLNLRDMDQTNLGMEFVLTLEAPCLHHTQGDPHQPSAPTGHILTASAPLLFQSPSQPVDTNSPSSTAWDTSHLGLEKLLSLSSNFELTDELTPVQAWHQLRSHPDFDSIEISQLRKLTEEMLKNIKCYGFGAVIDTEIFARLARSLFPRGGFDYEFVD